MKALCEKHMFSQIKKRGNTIQIIARVLPTQQLTNEQQKCEGGLSCYRPVKWVARYISEMNIKIIPKKESNADKVSVQDSEDGE